MAFGGGFPNKPNPSPAGGALAGAKVGAAPPAPAPANPSPAQAALAGAQQGAAPPKPAAPSQPQVGNPGSIAGTAQAQIGAFKQTASYVNSVLSVFKAQSPWQQQKIVQGAAKNPSAPESKAVLDYVKSTSQQGAAQGAAAGAAPSSTTVSAPLKAAGSPVLDAVKGAAMNAIAPGAPALLAAGKASGIKLAGQPQSTAAVIGTPGLTAKPAFTGGTPAAAPAFLQPRGVKPGTEVPVKDARNSGLAALSPTGLPIAALGSAAQAFGAATANPGQFAQNLGKDAATFVPNTAQGLYSIGSHLAQGDLAGAVHQIIDPYAQFFSGQGGKMLFNNPLTTTAMLAGPEAAVGRGAGAVMRSGVLGKGAKAVADTTRAPLQLGQKVAGAPNPLVELRSYSPNVLHQALQKSYEGAQRSRGLDPNIARPAPGLMPSFLQHALNVGLEAKTHRIADEMTAARQMAGREARNTATGEMRAARPDHPAAQPIVTHVLQRVIRTRETAAADIRKEIDRLKAAQTGSRTRADFANRAQVRDLSRALKHPEAIEQAFKSAEGIGRYLNNADKFVVGKGLLEPDQAMRSKLFPYAQAHMGAVHDPGTGGLAHDVMRNGVMQREILPTDKILDHLAQHGVSDPAFVGHYPAKGAFWNYYKRWQAARGSLSKGARTGEAFRRGNYDHTYEGLTGQVARTAEAVSNATFHDNIVNRYGVGKPKALQAAGENGLWTPKESREAAHAMVHDDNGNPIPGAQKWVPMAVSPKGTLDAIAGLQHPAQLELAHGHELQAMDRALNEVHGRNDGVRNLVLVPEAGLNRLKEQFKPGGDLGHKVGAITQQFRRTVLPYSTHWMGQIATEAALRGVVAGVVDPRNIGVGRQLMKALKGSEEGRAALRETTNQTFFNKNDPLARHNPNPGAISTWAHTLPVSRHIIATHNAYANFIGHAMGSLEHQFRLMGLGKEARRQVQEFTKLYQTGVRLHGQNISHLVTQMKTDPALVAKMGRNIDATFGQYNKFTPKVRAMTQTVAPFLPWYLNAAKFVLWNLPVKHPVASALLASLRQTINNDTAEGQQPPLGKFAEEALARVTPFGILPQPETPNAAGVASELARLGLGVVAPQASGAALNVLGLNPFGQPLKGPGGTVKAFAPQALASGLNSGLQALFPGLRQAQVAREGGGKAYGTSTLWSPQPRSETTGNWQTVVNRLFNPLYSFQSAQAGDQAAGTEAGANGSGGGSLPGFKIP